MLLHQKNRRRCDGPYRIHKSQSHLKKSFKNTLCKGRPALAVFLVSTTEPLSARIRSRAFRRCIMGTSSMIRSPSWDNLPPAFHRCITAIHSEIPCLSRGSPPPASHRSIMVTHFQIPHLSRGSLLPVFHRCAMLIPSDTTQ